VLDAAAEARLRGMVVRGLVNREAVEFYRMLAARGNADAQRWLSTVSSGAAKAKAGAAGDGE
jgi:hypothetical protein